MQTFVNDQRVFAKRGNYTLLEKPVSVYGLYNSTVDVQSCTIRELK